jgi:Fur family ferric uptake transcriptional regulator
MACEEVFLRELRERGFRLTPQREIVLSVMHEVEGMATAEEIYARVHEYSAAVDISTVYRTLDLLQELQVVACVKPGDGHYRYELLGVHGPHIHLVCHACHTVIAVEPEVAQPLAERLLAQYGFAVAFDRLSIPGLCQQCAHQTTNVN